MEGVPGEAVMGEFSFQAPDTGDAVYKLTYTADMDGFQAMGDHLPVPVIMDPVPEANGTATWPKGNLVLIPKPGRGTVRIPRIRHGNVTRLGFAFFDTEDTPGNCGLFDQLMGLQ